MVRKRITKPTQSAEEIALKLNLCVIGEQFERFIFHNSEDKDAYWSTHFNYPDHVRETNTQQ